MNRNGFTLAELLGVVVILSILSLIAVTTVDTKLKEGRIKTCLTQEKNIIEGAKIWLIDHPKTTNGTTVKVSDLEEQGYIESDLKNPMTDNSYTSYTRVIINVSDSVYTYTVDYVDEVGCI